MLLSVCVEGVVSRLGMKPQVVINSFVDLFTREHTSCDESLFEIPDSLRRL